MVWVENSPADETDILSVSTTFFVPHAVRDGMSDPFPPEAKSLFFF